MAWERREPRDVSDYSPQANGARCDICPLNGARFVPGEAPASGKKPKLIIVGEGPGQSEAVMRQPFIGRSGKFLNEALEGVNLRREDMYVTNTFMCLPETEKDGDRAAECCAPRLYNELATLPADVPIMALGKSAARSVLGVRSILLARGFVWTARSLENPIKAVEAAVRKAERYGKPLEDLKLRREILHGRHALAGRIVLPTVHPAFVLRSDVWTPIMNIDFDRAAKWVRGELTAKDYADEGQFDIVTKLGDVRKAFGKLGSEIACDIETGKNILIPGSTGKNPITAKTLCVGLSDGEYTMVIEPWRPKVHAKLLTKELAKRTTGFHNGFNFDQIRLEGDGVTFDMSKIEDTLLGHHAFASHFPQRLDHVVSVFIPCATPWKIKHGMRGGAEEKGLLPDDMTPDERALYNSGDARLQARVWNSIQADLESERAVYEHDKQLATICKEMYMVGIRRDEPHAKALSEKMRRRSAQLKGVMRKIVRRSGFSPSKLEDVRKALRQLNVGTLFTTPTGMVSTASATMEAIASNETRAGYFATALLKWRGVNKARSTYIEAPDIQALADGRFHPNWKPFGTVCMPAGELVLTNRGYLPIEEVQVNDLVISHTGLPRKVTALIDNGPASIYRVKLSNGLSLRTNGKHPYRVGSGWVEAAKLRRGVAVTVHSKQERWSPVIGWPFSVSSWGRVRSDTGHIIHTYPKYKDTNQGHRKVQLWRNGAQTRVDGDRKDFSVHRLVLQAFVVCDPSKPEVRHINGIPWDNTVENLVWGTSKDNRLDAQGHGTMIKRAGRQAKMTEEWAAKVRAEATDYQDELRFAEMYSVSRELIRDIRFGKRWMPHDVVGPRVKFHTAKVVSVAVEGIERTYGLEVEVDHSHVTGGIVTHNTGRLSSRAQSMPRRVLTDKAKERMRKNTKLKVKDIEVMIGLDEAYEIESRVREIYIPADGCEFIYFDLAQSEMRGAAYLSGDENFINSCESGDVHTANAKILFGADQAKLEVLNRDPKGEGKQMRDLTKCSGFGVLYRAAPDTIFSFLHAQGFPVDLAQVEAMFAFIYEHYARYYAYCDERLAECQTNGFLRTALVNRIRWLGFFPEPTIVSNFSVQSLIADMMNLRLIELRKRLPKSARPVFQGHDSVALEVKSGPDAHLTESLIKELWSEPIFVPSSGLSFVMPVDMHRGGRLSDF